MDICSLSTQEEDAQIHDYLSSASKEMGFPLYLSAVVDANSSEKKPLFGVDLNGVPFDILNLKLNLSKDVVNKGHQSSLATDEASDSPGRSSSDLYFLTY